MPPKGSRKRFYTTKDDKELECEILKKDHEKFYIRYKTAKGEKQIQDGWKHRSLVRELTSAKLAEWTAGTSNYGLEDNVQGSDSNTVSAPVIGKRKRVAQEESSSASGVVLDASKRSTRSAIADQGSAVPQRDVPVERKKRNGTTSKSPVVEDLHREDEQPVPSTSSQNRAAPVEKEKTISKSLVVEDLHEGDEQLVASSSTQAREVSMEKRKTNGTASKSPVAEDLHKESEQFAPGPEADKDGDVPMPSTMDQQPLQEVKVQQEKPSIKRNFDKVNFHKWQIKTWYSSPYPFSNAEEDDVASVHSSSRALSTKAHNGNRSNARGRAGDIAGGAAARDGQGEKAILWVCDRCFKYMKEGHAYELHSRACQIKHPPGRKVYQRGAHIIWEVDGAKEKLFCQNLSLFGKLFIDVKTLYFDCDNFMFYLMTDADSQRDHVLGFFSKEKHSFDDYNLACIITFPPHQRKRFGMLMIEFSYELSRRAGKFGTPERPLSNLGLRSYLTYWITVLVHYFRRILSINPAEISSGPSPDDDLKKIVFENAIKNGRPGHKRKKSTGWDAESEVILHNKDVKAATSGENDLVFRTKRHLRTLANADGSATTHVLAKCTLEDISKATGIRTDDIAFALHECGLLTQVRELPSEEGRTRNLIVVSRETVEQIAKQRTIKKLVMEGEYVLL